MTHTRFQERELAFMTELLGLMEKHGFELEATDDWIALRSFDPPYFCYLSGVVSAGNLRMILKETP